MKKVFVALLIFLLFGFFHYTNAFNQNKVDLLLEKIENKVSKKDLKVQKDIYKKMRNKLVILKIKNKNGKNKELVEYLYSKINKKYKAIFKDFILFQRTNGIECLNYKCVIGNLENNKNIKGRIVIPFNFLFQSVHGASKIDISFNDRVIKYKSILVPNNITENNATIELSKMLIKKESFNEDVNKLLSRSVDSLNRVIGYGEECSFDILEKDKFINILKKWDEGEIGSNDLQFANCNITKDSSIAQIPNIYKDKLLEEEKNKNDLEKDKYFDELKDININFISFKEEYDIGENIEGKIEVLNLSENFIAIISNGEGDFYRYSGKNKYMIYERGNYASNISYYNIAGIKDIKVNIYKKDLLREGEDLFFSSNKLENKNNIFKSFKLIFNIIDDPSINFVNGKEIDSDYEELGDNLFNKAGIVYYLDRENNFIELEGVNIGKYKLFKEFIYTGEHLFFESFGKYSKINFKSDYDSFELIYGEYFKDKNYIYNINDFYNKVTIIEKGNIVNINEGCFDLFLVVDNTLYKAGNAGGGSCNDILEKYNNYKLEYIQ